MIPLLKKPTLMIRLNIYSFSLNCLGCLSIECILVLSRIVSAHMFMPSFGSIWSFSQGSGRKTEITLGILNKTELNTGNLRLTGTKPLEGLEEQRSPKLLWAVRKFRSARISGESPLLIHQSQWFSGGCLGATGKTSHEPPTNSPACPWLPLENNGFSFLYLKEELLIRESNLKPAGYGFWEKEFSGSSPAMQGRILKERGYEDELKYRTRHV